MPVHDDKEIAETFVKLMDAFAGKDKDRTTLIVKFLKALLKLLGSATVVHDLVDPGPPTCTGLPIKNILPINGTGYIEATGVNESSSTNPIGYVVARIFRMNDTVVVPPTPADIAGDVTGAKAALFALYTAGTPDPLSGMYYSFLGTQSQMIPGAKGGGSDDNLLVTWAKFNYTDAWTKVHANRQFIGINLTLAPTPTFPIGPPTLPSPILP